MYYEFEQKLTVSDVLVKILFHNVGKYYPLIEDEPFCCDILNSTPNLISDHITCNHKLAHRRH